MAIPRTFGEIAGIAEGDIFQTYKDMNRVRIHTPTNAGISGSQNEGAESIVISGGYEDDQDFGDEIIYTGSGGQDGSGKQIGDQTLTRSNKALAKNEIDGLPVRVIRGAHKGNPFAPSSGYRYDGLYRVDSHWSETGKSGFKIYRFRLIKLNNALPPKVQTKSASVDLEKKYGRENPKRATQTVQRVIRDSKLGRQLKKLYDYKCQVCDLQIETDAGFYAEAAHIKPVGSPHDGPDLIENLLCLCPNHHLMFDKGVFFVNEDLSLDGIGGRLQLHKNHTVESEYFAYHRGMFDRDKQ
jgi:putative restriction endonuclease